MRQRPPAPGFSLVEVILAVGIFALAVPTMLALFGHLGRLGAASEDALTAQRLPDAVRLELRRLASPGFDALAAQIPVMSSTAQPGFALVAAREGGRVDSRDYLAPFDPIPGAGQYFLVECWRFGDEPLCFDSQKAYLALSVRVSWPYHLPDGSPSVGPPYHASFTLVLNR